LIKTDHPAIQSSEILNILPHSQNGQNCNSAINRWLA